MDFKEEMKAVFVRAPVAALWKTRFHRPDLETKKTQTKGWMFFLSRPALEFCRKMDKETESIINFLRSEIFNFIESNNDAKTWVETSYNNKIRVDTRVDEERYLTLIYPFSLENEVPGKYGVFIHIGTNQSKTGLSPEMRDISCNAMPTMFEEKSHPFNQAFQEKFENAPGTEWSDPMWSEFSGSKLLPTDILIKPNSEDANGSNWKEFNRVIGYQFIEIRLLSSPGDEKKRSSGEQIEALKDFSEMDSGFINFSGAPGTGKSTMLHMVCADRLAKNWAISEKDAESDLCEKIMYYVPSRALQIESFREIEAILKWVYRLDFADTSISAHLKNLHIFTPADLYATKTLSRKYNLLYKGADASLLKIPSLSQLDSTKLSMFKTHIRRLIFGVFGTPAEFYDWERNVLRKFPRKEQQVWSKNALNLQKPDQVRGGVVQPHDFFPSRFLAYDDLDPFLRRLKHVYQRLHTSDEQQDVFWDSSTMITVAARTKKNWTNKPWSALKGKIDYFVVDEIQDFTISEIRSLLNHFSNRQDGQLYRNFKFVCAGDENQNVRHLIYIPRNDHFRGLYEDWWISLNHLSAKSTNKKSGIVTPISLAHDLDNRKATNFLSSYRIFDEMLPYAKQILDKLAQLYDDDAKGATIEKTVFGRSGALIVPTHGKKPAEQEDDFWREEILNALRRQLECDAENLDNKLSNNPPPIRVSLSYSNSDISPLWAENNTFRQRDDHPLTERLLDSKKSTSWHDELNVLIQDFKKKFLARIDEVAQETPPQEEQANLLMEWRYELESRGVFSSQGIKGLTLPISIILPAKNLSVAEDNHTAEALCEYLVQLTRAQYVNVLLDPPNFTSAKVLNTDMSHDSGELQLWLNSILRGVAGYEDTLERIYETALQNNTNILRWERLLARTRNSDNKELIHLAVWLKKTYSFLYKGSGLTSAEVDELFVSSDSEITAIRLRKEETDDQKDWRANLKDIQNLEQFPLSGNRFDENIIASLILFFAINNLLRQPPDDVSKNREFLLKSLRRAMDAIPEGGQLTDTKHWLELINDAEDDTDLVRCSELISVTSGKDFTSVLNLLLSNSAVWLRDKLLDTLQEERGATLFDKLEQAVANGDRKKLARINSVIAEVSEKSDVAVINKIRSLLITTFRTNHGKLAEDWTWPSPALPRLFLGSWNLSNPGIDEVGDTEDENADAWMTSGQAYYTIPKTALYTLLNLKSDSMEKSRLLKVRIMISMNTLDHNEFLDSLKNYIEEQYRLGDEENAKSMWDWFFSVLNHESCPSVFKSALTSAQREENSPLEFMLSNHVNVRSALANCIEESKSIGDFVTKLETLNLKNWGNIKMPKITQKIVERAYEYIKSTDRYVSVNAKLESIQREINNLEKERRALPEVDYAKRRESLNETKSNLQKEKIEAERLYKAQIRNEGEVIVAKNVFEKNEPIHNLLNKVYSKVTAESEVGQKSVLAQQRMFEVLSKIPAIVNKDSYEKIAQEKIVFPSMSPDETSELFTAFIGCLDYWTVYTPPKHMIEERMKNLRRNDATEKSAKVSIAKTRAMGMVKCVLSDMTNKHTHRENYLVAWNQYIISANKLSNVKGKGSFTTPAEEVKFFDALHNEFRKDRRFHDWIVDEFLLSEVRNTVDSWEAFMTSPAASLAYACLKKGHVEIKIESNSWDKDHFEPNFSEVVKPNRQELFGGVQIPWTPDQPPTVSHRSELPWRSQYMIHGLCEAIIHKNLGTAIDLFEKCHAYNHSIALQLHRLFQEEHGRETFEKNFIRSLLNALRRERKHLLETTFLVFPGGTYEQFQQYRYGAFIVQQNIAGTLDGINTVQHIFGADPKKYRKKGEGQRKYHPNKHKDITIKSEESTQQRIEFLALHDAFENMERLADMIEQRYESASDNEDFLAKLRKIDPKDFTTFKNPRKMNYTWTWGKRGYEPTETVQDPNIPKIIKFILATLETKDLELSEFVESLIEITGLKGMLRDFISPPKESKEAIEQRAAESENLLKILHQNFSEIIKQETNVHDIEAIETNRETVKKLIHLTNSKSTHEFVEPTLSQLQGVNVQQAIRKEWQKYLKKNDFDM